MISSLENLTGAGKPLASEPTNMKNGVRDNFWIWLRALFPSRDDVTESRAVFL